MEIEKDCIESLKKQLEQLQDSLEELSEEYKKLLDDYANLEQDLQYNYKPINPHDFYGVNERDF